MGVDAIEVGGTVEDELLTDAHFRNLKPRQKQYKESAGRGMYMLVMPNGAKYWRLKYRHQGTERVYAIGVYPEVGLSQARQERDRARQWLREGKDPTVERKAARTAVALDQARTFRAVAEEWYANESPTWAGQHKQAQRSRLDKKILPYIGDVPIKDLQHDPQRIKAVLQRIYNQGNDEVLRKCKTIMSKVFLYAVDEGVTMNPADLLEGKFKRRNPVVNRKRIDLEEMPQLFEALAKVPSEAVTKAAIYFLILTAARTGEVRFATWREIQQGGKIWRVPPDRMKMDREHLVPLPEQARAVLTTAKSLRVSDDPDALIFPGFTRKGHGALSENALLALLARAGFFGRQTAHGFRGSFSTWAHELMTQDDAPPEANPDVIELCLAHVQGGIRGVYNDSKHIPQRRKLLQRWADQCTAWGMSLHIPS